ncbi:MAG: hypothetical protein Faunusvirus26_1, partial [Faunusvirus sp.]
LLENKHNVTLSKKYTPDSDYEEMEMEKKFHLDRKNKDNGVTLCKTFLLHSIQAAEYLNDTYDPFNFKLTGWHDHTKMTADSYDEVLGELYDKWFASGKKMEPEVKLILMILFSGASFHASQKLAKHLPGLDDAIKKNPALLTKLQETMFKNMGGNQNQAQHLFTQQQLYNNMKQMKSQPPMQNMNAQQMNSQQMNSQQMNSQQMNSQPVNNMSVQNTIPIINPTALNLNTNINSLKAATNENTNNMLNDRKNMYDPIPAGNEMRGPNAATLAKIKQQTAKMTTQQLIDSVSDSSSAKKSNSRMKNASTINSSDVDDSAKTNITRGRRKRTVISINN